MLTTFASYQLIARDLDRSLEIKGAEKPVARETEYYLKTISSIRSVEDFLGNRRVYQYAMKAFGLEEMTYAKAYMRKILDEGIAAKDSFANKVNDERFKAFATTFNFAEYGALTTQRAETRQAVVDKHVRQALEVSAGEDNEGVRLALYFQRTAPSIKSVYGIMADPAVWKVVQTVFGFPPEMAAAAIEKQAAAVSKRLDIESLSDPEQLAKLVKRFTTMWDVSENSAPAPVLALFNSGRNRTVGLDLVMALSNLRRGGF